MNRKYFKILLSVLMIFALLFVACGEKEKSIKITGNKDLEVGETLQLTATVENGATEDKVKWSSSNENLAKIEEGLLTALAAGNVTIKAELTTDAKVYAEVSVTIKEKEVVLNPEITSLEGENKLFVGEETTLVAQTKDLGDKTLVWTSSDDTIATVENGLVKALKEGKVTITCKVEGLDDTAKTLEIEIVDLSKVVIELNVTQGNIDELYANDVLKLSYTLSIEGLEVVWSSSDDSIAKVEDGVVTCLKVGNVTITVSLVENPEVKTSINVNVKSETSSVDVLKEYFAMGEDAKASWSNVFWEPYPEEEKKEEPKNPTNQHNNNVEKAKPKKESKNHFAASSISFTISNCPIFSPVN